MPRPAVLVSLALLVSPAVARADGPERWALLIGVDQYRNEAIRDLEYADDDVIQLRSALLNGGWAEDHIIAMTPASPERRFRPTLENIAAELAHLQAVVAPGDEVVLSFSGHGVGVRDGGTQHNFLLPMDANLADLQLTALDLDAVLDRLGRTQAARRLVIVDACRGAVEADARGVALDTIQGTGGMVPEGTMVMFASKFGTSSYEAADRSMGAFTAALVDGLAGGADLSGPDAAPPDGWVDTDELLRWTRDRLHERCVQSARCQEPWLTADTSGGPFALVRVPASVGVVEVDPDPVWRPRWLELSAAPVVGVYRLDQAPGAADVSPPPTVEQLGPALGASVDVSVAPPTLPQLALQLGLQQAWGRVVVTGADDVEAPRMTPQTDLYAGVAGRFLDDGPRRWRVGGAVGGRYASTAVERTLATESFWTPTVELHAFVGAVLGPGGLDARVGYGLALDDTSTLSAGATYAWPLAGGLSLGPAVGVLLHQDHSSARDGEYETDTALVTGAVRVGWAR